MLERGAVLRRHLVKVADGVHGLVVGAVAPCRPRQTLCPCGGLRRARSRALLTTLLYRPRSNALAALYRAQSQEEARRVFSQSAAAAYQQDPLALQRLQQALLQNARPPDAALAAAYANLAEPRRVSPPSSLLCAVLGFSPFQGICPLKRFANTFTAGFRPAMASIQTINRLFWSLITHRLRGVHRVLIDGDFVGGSSGWRRGWRRRRNVRV